MFKKISVGGFSAPTSCSQLSSIHVHPLTDTRVKCGQIKWMYGQLSNGGCDVLSTTLWVCLTFSAFWMWKIKCCFAFHLLPSQPPAVVWSGMSQSAGSSLLVFPATTATTWPAIGCWRPLRARVYTFTLRRWRWLRTMIGKQDNQFLYEDGWTL